MPDDCTADPLLNNTVAAGLAYHTANGLDLWSTQREQQPVVQVRVRAWLQLSPAVTTECALCRTPVLNALAQPHALQWATSLLDSSLPGSCWASKSLGSPCRCHASGCNLFKTSVDATDSASKKPSGGPQHDVADVDNMQEGASMASDVDCEDGADVDLDELVDSYSHLPAPASAASVALVFLLQDAPL